ncbi:TadE/TadG family type IV pilus assembly protein [Ensifer adhaerens]|uniref:TadE/TadG family type IV pilus assembly protein n=1 Tax=Ensifer TaxID=106591 RepID=UPI00072BD3AB|nr:MULTISPECIES: TadE/TadG family type IV pilus assembly protein [unclassified Ensifer]KSV79718.1 signal peptide protein [Sinorhizobium sp. GW3]MBD9495360.1 pilus assembly protein [Ensifer sp. ENS01]MBD9519011.1 pilus assembly protein [Ensifer sp. ENS02]MBD9568742.1 pilus assembly protein [Ensifer sp. ENS08]
MSNFKRLIGGRDGAAAIEFAIIAPLFFMCVLTLIAYGVYLSAAHSIQQIAADAARTAIAGLSQTERERLATDYIRRTTMDQAFIKSSRMTVTVRDDANNANQFTVRIKYDAGDLPIFNLFTFAMPSEQIERFATIRIGGV